MWHPGKKFSLLFAFGVLFLAGSFLYIYLTYKTPLETVIGQNSRLTYLKELIIPKKGNKIIYGFLPYWNIENVTLQKELTNLAYFSLTIDKNGQIITKNAKGELEPGYNKLNSEKFIELSKQAQVNNQHIELVFSQFDNDDIATFINDEKAQLNFFTSLDSLLLAYPISGINIDIEYSGEITPQLKDNFTTFMRKLDWYLNNKYPQIKISTDVYASAASADANTLWDLPALEPYVDYVIVMAYDFHSKVSTQAGPVAPLFSSDEPWNKDINQHLKEFLAIMDRQKIILGLPFYGYGWQTEGSQPNANTYPQTGFTVSYQKAKELLKLSPDQGNWSDVKNVQTGWDENALSPYISYEENDKNYLIYYENPQSLNYKIEYAKQLDLAGIAIWALGYEGNDRDLWDVIEAKL